jgi:hypothetical protein
MFNKTSNLPIIRWENATSRRYYLALLHKDLLQDWVLIKCWGGKNSRKGRMMTEYCKTYEEGCCKLNLLGKRRLKRGYHKLPEANLF